jgi:hypothetical protein
MDTINRGKLTDKDSSFPLCITQVCTQFSTINTPNLWKTIINDVLIARINIRLLSIRVLNVFTNRRVIRCGNVIFCSDLGEQIITQTPKKVQTSEITLNTTQFYTHKAINTLTELDTFSTVCYSTIVTL